jgi:hypothetical protein
MKYFVPQVKLSTELPAQIQFEEKFGGSPWGLPAEKVPTCSHCGTHQILIAQLLHHPKRLDLGAIGRVLCVFQCEGGYCPAWDGGSGANACFVIEPHELIDAATPIPKDMPPPNPEVRIIDWFESEDGVSPELASDFFDEQRYSNLPNELLKRIPNITRLGGVPVWCQSADEAPKGWQFAGQFQEEHRVFESPPGQGLEMQELDLGTGYQQLRWIGGHNFGTGSAYIFLRHQSEKPEGWFFWQC